MVASWFWVGFLVPGGGLPVGRFRSYKSFSFSRGGGEGDAALRGGLGGGPPLPAPPASWSSCGRAGAGTAGGLCRRRWVPPSKGLPSTSRIGGVVGRGTVVATRNNSPYTLASCCSRAAIQSRSSFRCCSSVSTFCWWLAAHFSTLPWNSIKWTFLAMFASNRKATALCIRATCITSWTQCSLLVLECSMMAPKTCRVNIWYAFADIISSFLTQSPEICSLASICS